MRTRCLHEALHGVILSRFFTVRSISVRPQRHQGRVVAGLTRYNRPAPGDRAGLLGELVGVLAGAVGVAMRHGRPDTAWDYALGDLDRAEAILEAVTSSPWEQDRVRTICLDEARRLVTALWPMVEAVAEALLERGEITGRELRRLIAAHSHPVKKASASSRPIIPVPQHAIRLPLPEEALRLAGRAVTQTRLGFPSLRSVTLQPVPPGEEIKNYAPSPNQLRTANRSEQNEIARVELLAHLVGEIAAARSMNRSLDALGAVERSGGREYLNLLGNTATERVRIAEELFQEALMTVMRREGTIRQVADALLQDPDKTLMTWEIGAIVGGQRGLP